MAPRLRPPDRGPGRRRRRRRGSAPARRSRAVGAAAGHWACGSCPARSGWPAGPRRPSSRPAPQRGEPGPVGRPGWTWPRPLRGRPSTTAGMAAAVRRAAAPGRRAPVAAAARALPRPGLDRHRQRRPGPGRPGGRARADQRQRARRRRSPPPCRPWPWSWPPTAGRTRCSITLVGFGARPDPARARPDHRGRDARRGAARAAGAGRRGGGGAGRLGPRLGAHRAVAGHQSRRRGRRTTCSWPPRRPLSRAAAAARPWPRSGTPPPPATWWPARCRAPRGPGSSPARASSWPTCSGLTCRPSSCRRVSTPPWSSCSGPRPQPAGPALDPLPPGT